MTSKIAGTVNFYMRAKKGSDVMETTYETLGTLYVKNDKTFLFFEETNLEDNSVTKCRLEFDSDKMRIRRDGQIIMDQSYCIDKKVGGYIKTPYGQLPTEARTHRYRVQQSETGWVIGLAYDLFIGEDKAGKYDLKVRFNKEDMA